MQKGRLFENGYRASEEYPEYIDHWLYFANRSDAEKAAEKLRERGWSTNVTSAPDDMWLALATQPATGDEDTGPIFEELTAFAEKHNGIYDGYERPMDEGDFMN
ncbi:MAG TPA: ribonuclease E inhibitor RraB [Candidatus Angelobacter sp.]|nr:ribonuclease E inhibitor RraB [Candidatus Angelobacter sp.]